jgi:hypothetical protein
VYYLPAACNDLLETMLCQRCSSEVCSPEVTAARLQLLRKYAQEYVQGCKDGRIRDLSAVRLA